MMGDHSFLLKFINIYSLLVAISKPFYDWAESLRSWLKTSGPTQILIFSYYIEDWGKLRLYLDNGVNPEWNSNNGQNPRSIEFKGRNRMLHKGGYDTIKENQEIQSDLKPLFASKNPYPKISTISNLILQGKDSNKSLFQQKWIKEIMSRYKNKFSLEIMNRFSEDYPSLTELSEELSCTIQEVENEIKGIRRYLKSVEIHDLYDPLTFRQRYFSWKNENLGQNLMQKEIIKALNDKRIKFNLIFLNKNISALIVHEKILICTIFEESELSEFINIFESISNSKKYDKILLISHTIELRYFCERKIKKDHSSIKIEFYLYDWAALGPVIRELMRK